MRYGQSFIEKNSKSVLAFINPHGFLDNPTFRGMRWNLLKTYDKFYTIDLHGNSKKKEVSPDGSKDENVFDIMQGVSINLFIKSGKKKADELGKVFHYYLYGKRDLKYGFLIENSIQELDYKELKNIAPNYFFVQKAFDVKGDYDTSFSVNDLFLVNGVGMTTAHDEFVIDDNRDVLLQKFIDFKQLEPDSDELHNIFKVKKKAGWNILDGWRNLQHESNLSQFIKPIAYRPFDNKFIFYENKLVWRTVYKVMQHFLKGENVGLVFRRQSPEAKDIYIFISNTIIADGYIRSDNKGGESVAPLYLYPEITGLTSKDENTNRKPNLNKEIVQKIADKLGLKFTDEKEYKAGTFAPIDILDYIYAVLHCPSYREKYKEFLKIDFPRVPYPEDAQTFWQSVKFGSELRLFHLLEHPKTEQFITTYPKTGSNLVVKIRYESGKVRINEEQYFDKVQQIAWEFYIGGYQPAQKWLKDRKGRILTAEDIEHYQKIIVALTETDRLMKEIDGAAGF